MVRIETLESSRQVLLDGREVRLTAKEYDLWVYLRRHAGEVCTRWQLIDGVWGSRFAYDTGTLDVHIHSLRRKLHLSSDSPIRTIRGVGFLYSEQVSDPLHNQPMDWAKLFTNLMPNRLTAYSLQELVNHALHQYTGQWQSHSMRVEVHLDPFVHSIITEPETLDAIYDLILPLMMSEGSTLLLGSQLAQESFSLFIQSDQAVCLDDWSLTVAQRFAALLGMSLRVLRQATAVRVELTLLMEK